MPQKHDGQGMMRYLCSDKSNGFVIKQQILDLKDTVLIRTIKLTTGGCSKSSTPQPKETTRN